MSKQIDHNPNEPPHGTPSLWSVISYLIAAAILLPIGWWLKEHYSGQIGYYVLSLGGLLY
jgi:hypothetical protein